MNTCYCEFETRVGLRNDYNRCPKCGISKKDKMKAAKTLSDWFSIVYGKLLADQFRQYFKKLEDSNEDI